MQKLPQRTRFVIYHTKMAVSGRPNGTIASLGRIHGAGPQPVFLVGTDSQTPASRLGKFIGGLRCGRHSKVLMRVRLISKPA